jgi:MFS transporter, DHA2 family, methylenomycin A resistance protein
MTMTLAATGARPTNRRALILLTMSLGVLIAQIDTSVVNLAVKQIGASLHASVSVLQWFVDAYNLVYASLLLTAGALADIYGRRRIFVFGIVLFTAGSLVCGLAPNATVLIIGRGIAGLGAALEIPTSLAILTVAYPDTRERTRALGIWASCNGLAFVIGPTLGGVLVDAAGWRSIFLLIVPICAVALGLALTAVPESQDPKGRALDLPGQALAIAALGALSLGVIEGPHWGWASPASFSSFAIALVAAVLFFRGQAKSDAGLVPPAILKNSVFSACLGIAAAMTFGMYAMLFLTPLYLQTVRGSSALLAGFELLPMSVTFVIVSQLSGRIANRFGPRLPMTAGMAFMGTGLFMLALIALTDSFALIAAALLVIGCGLGLNTGPVNAVAVANVAAARSGTASGLVNTARMVGATLGVAVLGAVFAVFAGSADASGHIVRGLVPAFIGGGIGEMLGAVAAFVFIRRGSLHPVPQRQALL